MSASDPVDVETVQEFFGEFEPARRQKVYERVPVVRRPWGPAPRSSTLRVRLYHDVLLLPHHVILSPDGSVLPISFAPTYNGSLIPGGQREGDLKRYTRDRIGTPQSLAEPVFLAEAAFAAYGHVLLEALPKLMMLRGVPADTRIVTSTPPLRALLGAMGVREDRVLRFDRPLWCRSVYIPDPPVDLSGNFHTGGRAAFARIARLARWGTAPVQRRVFLSRSRIAARRLRNEAEIETLFRSYGFAIVNPELLPIEDQVRLLSGAELVAGPGGTAMHNLVVAPASTRVMILTSPDWISPIDKYISKTDDQQAVVVGAVSDTTKWAREREWTVDPELVEQAIHEHFGL